MNLHIKLPRRLYNAVRGDLDRPHNFAAERVGFLSARVGNAGGSPLLVLLTEYHSIPDHDYLPDPACGARINSAAIRAAMQRVLDSGNGCFHVHQHGHRGEPEFSIIDEDEIPKVIAGMRNAGPGLVHGMLLFSDDHAAGKVWLPGVTAPMKANRVSVIGCPISMFDRGEGV